MYYIQHKHTTWINWKQWGEYSSIAEAQEAIDKIFVLRNLRPSSCDGITYNSPYDGYYYRLMEDTPMVASGLENRGV